ncbi:MAG: hypothetical protein AAGC67_09110 [Myxococcota bacterium]
MDRGLFDALETKEAPPPAFVGSGDETLSWRALACACGGEGFRITGWPRITTGRGGLFWRSVLRVFRETRQPMDEGELRESPFWLPLRARCERCEREAVVLDDPSVADRLSDAGRAEPVESYRCRVCRRGRMALLVGSAADAKSPERADFVVVARCRACTRESRVAWSRGRPSDQEVALDVLYGRR